MNRGVKMDDHRTAGGASFNLYMGYGGTNFGWWSGANGGGKSYQPHITSYDYGQAHIRKVPQLRHGHSVPCSGGRLSRERGR